jgi:ubiquinone/menaquinone biosynthesis C-methylase UbiE
MPTPALTPLAAAVLQVDPPERALEVECGEGDGVFFLAREFPVARVRGVDRDEGRARVASERVGLDPEGRVAFKQARGGSLPYPDDLFDLVVQVDGRPPVAEIARVLRPGGQLILASTVGDGHTGRLLNWRLRRHGLELGPPVAVGDGSFRVGQLRGDGSTNAAE